jgi:multiple antibiotic resistance protein
LPQFLKTVILIITALFPIVNPIGSAPFFLAMTQDSTAGARRILAWRIARNSFLLLLGSLLIGSYILSFFGVSLPIVQIGGGLMVLSTGWTMLKRDDDDEREQIKRTVTPAEVMRKAFYPLTLPLTVGPGSISVAITLGANAPHPGGGRLALALAAVIAGTVVLALSVFLSYAFAGRVSTLLGPSAMGVMQRLSAFLLACIGLQIMWNGVHALLHLQ